MTAGMLASLPMYDLSAVRAATDHWWQGLAHHMRRAGIRDVPAGLTRDPAPSWIDPRLLISQACGYPLTHALDGCIEPVCTPVYAAPGCNGARYSSALVIAEGSPARSLSDLCGARCAYNAADSHSGYNVLRSMVAPLANGEAFFAGLLETGAHGASLDAVAAGEADLCAVDAVTHALVARHEPERLAGTRVLTFSPTAPGLPLVAGPCVTADIRARLQDAVVAAITDPDLEPVRTDLLIGDAEPLARSAYDEILGFERSAIDLAYPLLR